MSVALSEHLPLLAIAPDGIKKLRGLILELAMRGKLVSQDPNDDPAKELLIRIAAERSRLVGSGVCKKARSFPPVSEHDCPFQVPQGWLWVRLDEIGHDWGQQVPNSTFTYLDVSAIDNALGRINSPDVLCPEDAPSRARKIVKRGTVIYSTVRPYLLNIAVVDHDLTPSPIASTAFAVIHPLAGISSQFLFWYLRSPVFVRYVESVQTGIAYPAVNDSQFFSGLFPLAPISEQHRIVAKVDELMALCDRLESEQSDSEAAHARLVEALLGTLTQSTDAADLATNWQRIAEHFDMLFTTEGSVDCLKGAVLELAVRGKLAPQDPQEESACESLGRVVEARRRMEAEGDARKLKPMAPIGDGPFAISKGWAWTRLGELCSKITDGEHITPSRSSTGHYLLSARNVTNEGILLSDVDFVPTEEFERIRRRCDPNLGDVLISCSGSVGRVSLVDRNDAYAMVRSAAMIRPITAGTTPTYIAWCLRSPTLQDEMVIKSRQSAQANLFLGAISSLTIPLPPLSEQHRIVAKVDELMALCDRMKADLREARGQQSRLADTLIETALKVA